jgi:hypothetical protein
MEAKEILKQILASTFTVNKANGTVTLVVDQEVIDRAVVLTNTPDVHEFTLYFIGGKKEVVRGATIADACNKAGYGQGAISALDFYCKVGEGTYTYVDGNWKKD